jgi:hypothetical protein
LGSGERVDGDRSLLVHDHGVELQQLEAVT